VTLWYRAPELLLGSASYSFGVDVWSVACIIAEIVTNVPPFRGQDETEQIRQIFEYVHCLKIFLLNYLFVCLFVPFLPFYVSYFFYWSLVSFVVRLSCRSLLIL
jgi:serine/threonine protein kinase